MSTETLLWISVSLFAFARVCAFAAWMLDRRVRSRSGIVSSRTCPDAVVRVHRERLK